jgi:DNA polymerase III subunit delta
MIIFLYGPDSFRSIEKLKSLKERFTTEVDKSGLNLISIDGEKTNINDINKAIATRSFLSSKRMIVIKSIFSAGKAVQNEVLELLKSGDYRDGEKDNVIIFWNEKVDKRSSLYKYLNVAKFKEEFLVLEAGQLTQFILKRVVDGGGKINQQNAYLLSSKSDGNLWALSGEIDKLLAKKKKGEIEKEDIEQSVLFKIDDNIFNLVDAVANRNKKLALKLIHDQLESGVNELYLHTMIVRQFRILIQVKNELEKGGSNNREIASELGIHPFVVQKAMPQARSYEMDYLKKIYAKLLEIDIRLKLGGSGKTLLEVFVVEI